MTDRLLLAQISVDVRDIQKQMNRAGLSVDTASRRMAQTWRTNTNAMARDTEQFGRDVARAITAIGLTAAAGQITSLADAWTRAGNQISAAAAATGTAAASLSSVAAIARSTRTEFEATATLYARLTRATGDLGASQEQVAEATRLINQAFVAGGASATEQASAVLQLSQALQSGVLQGDELRSLRESSPIILAAIAKEFGVAQGALKQLGAEGKLTSDKIFSAILKAAPEIEAQFAVTQTTVADSFTNLRTAAVEYVGQLDNSLGATAGFSQVVNHLADNFEYFADALIGASFLLGARGLGGALNRAGVDFAKYASGIGTRRAEMIKDLQRQADETKVAARQAALAVQEEQTNLANIKKAREDAARANTGDDRAIVQSRKLAQARREVAAAEAALDAVNKKKKVSTDEQEAATRRLTLAQANLNALERQRTGNLEKSEMLTQQEIAATQRLTRAKNDLALAKQRAQSAARALSAAQNLVGATARSVLAFFGGPLGVAFTATAAAVAFYTAKNIEAERAIRSVNSALEILAEGYGVTEGLARDAAGASAQLTAEMKAQKDAAEALAAIERQNRRDDYIKGLEDARKRVKALTAEVAAAEGKALDLSFAFKYNRMVPPEEFNERLERARNDLADMQRFVRILEAGLSGLEAIGFEKPKVSTELPDAPAATVDTKAEEAAAKAALKLQERAASDAESLIERIRGAWDDYYTWRDEQIRQDLAKELKAIEDSALSAAEKIEAKTKAQETAAAKLREYFQDEIEAEEEARKATEDAAQREIDLLSQIMNERDRMLGRFISISAREYAQRRADIEKNITDEARRNEALRALAEEEAEFRRQVRADVAALDQRSDDGSQIAAVQESMRQKLQFMQEAQAMELAALQENEEAKLALIEEYEALRREIIADSEAEIQAIRTASADMLLSASSNLFGNLANLARTFAGESSGIFKALFFAEKAFALASAYVNMQLAIAKANASAPPPLNAPAILAAKVTGAAAIAGIIASTASGFKKGGYTGDGNPNDPAGIVHRGEFVVPAKAVKAIGRQNLESLRFGQLPRSSITGAVRPSPARNVSFGDMILNVSGEGAAEIRDELAGMLAAHRSAVARDIDRGFGSMLTRELKTTTPRHERRRP